MHLVNCTMNEEGQNGKREAGRRLSYGSGRFGVSPYLLSMVNAPVNMSIISIVKGITFLELLEEID